MGSFLIRHAITSSPIKMQHAYLLCYPKIEQNENNEQYFFDM